MTVSWLGFEVPSTLTTMAATACPIRLQSVEASDDDWIDERVDDDYIVKEEEEDKFKHYCTASSPLLLSHR